MIPDVTVGSWIDTDVPSRLDALGWSAWHRRVVLALGITWVLDGLEASLIANLAPTLQDPRTLGLTAAQIGLANTSYLVGQVLGALGFADLTDRFGRKRLFLVTLTLYLLATAASGLATNLGMFLVLRFAAGAGIGGEYAAINSAIDELVPARVRGAVDLAINGSYWIGIAAGAGLTLIAVFYAFATLVGAGAPAVFGALIDAGDPWQLFGGYVVAAAFMIGAAVVARRLGVAAEGRSLEQLRTE